MLRDITMLVLSVIVSAITITTAALVGAKTLVLALTISALAVTFAVLALREGSRDE